MGQLASITLNDGTSDLVFKPAGIDSNNVATLVNSDGVIVKDKSLTVSARLSAQRRKTTTKVALPVVQDETINGIVSPKGVRTSYVRVDTDFSVYATTAERVQAINLATAAVRNALIKAVIVDNDTLY